jgi:acyl-CoA synthetase (AMP-forming)/AMP-acid ligase II
MVRMALAPLQKGAGPATIVALGAARHPDHPAVIDERDMLTYAELDRRAAAVAAALRQDFGVGPNRALAVMCRNHRGFLEALLRGSPGREWSPVHRRPRGRHERLGRRERLPGEVEDLLRRHDGVDDAAVIGVDDEEFGQRPSAPSWSPPRVSICPRVS